MIGDTRAVEPLSNTLIYDVFRPVRQAAAVALGKIGDQRAIAPLVASINGMTVGFSEAFGALEACGWQPDQTDHSAAAAAHWTAREQWDKCVEIGEPAVEPLILALKEGRGSVAEVLGVIGDPRAIKPLFALLKGKRRWERQAAARALVSLYGRGGLDESQRVQILRRREVICQPHHDGHCDERSGCFAFAEDYHTDEGIGVEFPI